MMDGFGNHQCKAKMYGTGRLVWSTSLCSKRAYYDHDENGVPTRCKIHSAEYLKGKQEKRKAEAQAYSEEMDRKQAVRWAGERVNELKEEAINIVRIIGTRIVENPRALAYDITSRLEEAQNLQEGLRVAEYKDVKAWLDEQYKERKKRNAVY